MCPTRHFVYIFFNPVFQLSTAKNEINLFNNHVLIVAPVTFAPAGAMTPSAEFFLIEKSTLSGPILVNDHNQVVLQKRKCFSLLLLKDAACVLIRMFTYCSKVSEFMFYGEKKIF